MALSAKDQALVDGTPPPVPPRPVASPKPAGWKWFGAPPEDRTLKPATSLYTQLSTGPNAPLAPLVPVVSGAQRAAGTTVGKVFDVANRLGEANLARHARGWGAGFNTLVHSEDPQQYQKDTALASAEMEGLTPEEYAKRPGFERAANEFATQIIYDPITYAGGLGVVDHLMEVAGAKTFPQFAKFVQAMEQSSNPTVKLAGKGIASSYDFTHYKGTVERKLAAKYGEEGVHYFRGLKSINNARRTQALDLSQSLLNQYHDVVKGLDPNQEYELYQAVHSGGVDKLEPNLAMRAAKFKNITDQLAHLEADPELRDELAKHGFQLPASMKRFEGEEPRGMQGVGSFRKDYVPTEHEAATFERNLDKTGGIMGLDQPASSSLRDILQNPEQRDIGKTHEINAEDVSLRERAEHGVMQDPDIQKRLIKARLRSGAQAIAAHDAEARVAELFGKKSWQHVPKDAQEFFRETYVEPGGAEFWKGIARGAVDIPKVGLFSLPFRHMANIGSLAALADPGALPGTLGYYAHLMVMGSGSKRLSQLAEKAGATNAARFLDPAEAAARRAKILEVPNKYGVTGAAAHDSQRSIGWIGKIPGIGDVYKLSNHALWTFDDAAKAVRFNRLLKRYKGQGLDETHAAYRAADQVGAELIDYSNRSPLTKALSYIAPFSTYRSKAPGAVARSITHSPQVMVNAGRLSPELVGDEQQAAPNAKGQAQVGKSYLPLAEVLRGFENPMDYVRASSGYPFSMGASAAMDEIARASGTSAPDITNYFTYGKDPDLKYLANATLGSFPGGEAALGALGQGEFTNQGSIGGAVRGQTGFGISRGPSPTQLVLPALLENAQQQADAARKRGDAATAKAIETAIERVRERYRLYVP